MSQGVVKISGKEYKTVSLRVSEFRSGHAIDAGWSINTVVLQCTADGVLVRAEIINPEGRIVATGHAQEVWEGRVNSTSAVENCETSAIGRALAAAGLGGEEFASANEVERAIEQQSNDHTNKPKTESKPVPKKDATPVTIEKLLKHAEKLYGTCNDKDELLAALDRVAAGRDKFAAHEDFAKAINAVLNYTQTLSDEDVLHINRKASFLLARKPGELTAKDLEMEAEEVFG